jgi:hypothetical protein
VKTSTTNQKHEAAAPGQGADIVASGMLLERQNTVIADVLARFIAGERLTGLHSVTDSSTTRLAAVVHALGGYGWYIQRADLAAGCRDGRIATVSEYWLYPDQCAAALDAGAGAWVAEVRRVRAARRKNAPKARAAAASVNARKRKGSAK